MAQGEPENEAQEGEVGRAFGARHEEEHDAGDLAVQEEKRAEELPRCGVVKFDCNVCGKER